MIGESWSIYLGRNWDSNNHFHIDHIDGFERWIYMGIDLFVNCIAEEYYHYDVVFLLDDNCKLDDPIKRRLISNLWVSGRDFTVAFNILQSISPMTR